MPIERKIFVNSSSEMFGKALTLNFEAIIEKLNVFYIQYAIVRFISVFELTNGTNKLLNKYLQLYNNILY